MHTIHIFSEGIFKKTFQPANPLAVIIIKEGCPAPTVWALFLTTGSDSSAAYESQKEKRKKQFSIPLERNTGLLFAGAVVINHWITLDPSKSLWILATAVFHGAPASGEPHGVKSVVMCVYLYEVGSQTVSLVIPTEMLEGLSQAIQLMLMYYQTGVSV